MNPTTMADISRSKRSVVMSAMPDCFRMIVFSDLIGSSSLLIGIEIGHAAESNLGGQVSADVFASGCRGGGGTRAEVNVDGTDLVFIVTPGSRERRNRKLVHRSRRGAIGKIERKLKVFKSLGYRLRSVKIHRAHKHGMLGIGSSVQEVGDHPRSEEHTSELQSPCNLVCRLLLEK